jgi:hypothetical protein
MPDPFEHLPDVTERRDDWAEWEAMMASPSTDIISSAWDALASHLTPAQREVAMRPGSAKIAPRDRANPQVVEEVCNEATSVGRSFS